MQYLKINSITDVTYFKTVIDDLYCFTAGNVLIKRDKQFNSKWFVFLDSQWNINEYNNDCIYSFKQYKSFSIINKETGAVFIEEVNFKPLIVLNNKLWGTYLIKKMAQNIFEFGEYPLQKHIKIENDDSYAPIKFTGSFLISQNGYYLINCSNLCEILWQLSFQDVLNNKNANLQSEIICCNDKIFFFLSGSNNTIESFVVDIKTGKVLFQTKKVVGWLKLYDYKIYAVQPKAVLIMDANTYETETIELIDTLTPKDITLEWNKYIIDGDLLYFTDAFKPLVGVINLKTRKILWHTLIEIDNKNLQKVMEIKYDNDRLYVLTSDNTLHVFEKT